MSNQAVGQVLVALHTHLQTLLPDLIKLEELLRASLTLSHTNEVAALLQQRQNQCVAAVALLRGLPDGAKGREAEGLQALLAAQPFIESSAAMIRDVQNLLHVLTGPGELMQQPSIGTTERMWRQHGIQLVRPAPRGPAVSPPTSSAQPTQPAPLPQVQPVLHLPSVCPAQPPQPQSQQQPQHPAPLGLALLMQQERQDQLAMPPARPEPWASVAGGASAGSGAAGACGTGGPPLAAELLFSPSVEMLPVLPSIGALPTLSQLLEEPMMTLSLQDGDWAGVAAAAAAAAVAAVGDRPPQAQGQASLGAAGVQPQQQPQQPQQQQPEAAAVPGSTAGASPAWLLPQELPSALPDREESLQLLEKLLVPVPDVPRPGPLLAPSTGAHVAQPVAAAPAAAVATTAASAPAAAPTAASAPATAFAASAVAGVEPAFQFAPPMTTVAPNLSGAAGPQQPPSRFQHAPAPATCGAAEAHGGQASPSYGPRVPVPSSVAAPGQTAAAQHAAAQLAAVQLASAPPLAGTSAAPTSPGSSGEQPQTSGGSGSLSYRRVSFVPLSSTARSSVDESATASSRVAPATSLPFLARPPAVSSAATLSLPFPARPPTVPPTMAPDMPSAATAAAQPPATATAAAAAAAGAPTRVAVVQAGTAVRIAQSAAAPVPSVEEEQPRRVHLTAATAEGPISYVSVQEAAPHDFSQGETSLTRLFAAVKATGVLPLPEGRADGAEEDDGSITFNSARSHASSDGTADGSGASCADVDSKHSKRQMQAQPAKGVRQTRQQSRAAQQAEANTDASNLAPLAAAPQEEIGGTKRRRAKR